MTAKKAIAILTLSFAALAAVACASTGRRSPGTGTAGAGAAAPASGDVSFLAADLNHDGRISRDEFDTWKSRGGDSRSGHAFQAADTNLDGVLTLDEWQEMMGGASAAAGGSRAPGGSATQTSPLPIRVSPAARDGE